MQDIELNADCLELPIGLISSLYVDGMRELVTYSFAHDGFLARWDSIIDGAQYSVGKIIKSSEGDWAKSIQLERGKMRNLLIEEFNKKTPFEIQQKNITEKFKINA